MFNIEKKNKYNNEDSSKVNKKQVSLLNQFPSETSFSATSFYLS